MNTTGFIKVLNMLTFDEKLFRKEFGKTLKWVPPGEYTLIEQWLMDTKLNFMYPDLVTLVRNQTSANAE